MTRGTLIKVAKTIGMWLPALFLAWVFSMQGAAKFSETSGWAVAFQAWGYADWFRYTIGFAEILAAAFLLLPRTAPLGALLIIVIMLGGIGTHIAANDRFFFRSELGPIIFSSIILLVRHRELRAIAEWRPQRSLVSAS